MNGHRDGHQDGHREPEQAHGDGQHGGSVGAGLIVFVLLAALTGIEFAIAKEVDAKMVPLIVIAVVKASCILWYFMHVARSWLQAKREAE